MPIQHFRPKASSISHHVTNHTINVDQLQLKNILFTLMLWWYSNEYPHKVNVKNLFTNSLLISQHNSIETRYFSDTVPRNTIMIWTAYARIDIGRFI